MDPQHLPALFPPRLMNRLHELLDISELQAFARFDDAASKAALARAEVLITGWGCPPLDEALLEAAPRLRTVLHAAGSVRHLVSEAGWRRGIAVSSAVQANAGPVAEYTLAAILLAGKNAFALSRWYARSDAYPPAQLLSGIGNFRRRVGIIGASRVGRRLLELLRPFDFAISLSDPYVDEAEAARLGVTLLPLDDLLRTSDIVSVHAPSLPQTRHLLDGPRLALIPDGAVVINTARGALIDHDALTVELESGRLGAVLDVTDPEPLPASSLLHQLPNVFLTPHIAGSLGNELERLGRTVVDEAERLVDGLPLLHRVHQEDLTHVA
ncbi:hydroxyacid dehydrogenase [Streptomyces sp. MBT62]|uniref:hydroxyacid dehydrogenase n=1 Tax=Streptomyces sp. MBT62 TaxID=2800410 RepID=UPI00190DD4B4|nr:hydroxyacid dehydrogenase [Streptomyces sp. MBT62]MBK3563817.1 hydroxyacid dehydrogenase [Streptomyces sp. MBT62]